MKRQVWEKIFGYLENTHLTKELCSEWFMELLKLSNKTQFLFTFKIFLFTYWTESVERESEHEWGLELQREKQAPHLVERLTGIMTWAKGNRLSHPGTPVKPNFLKYEQQIWIGTSAKIYEWKISIWKDWCSTSFFMRKWTFQPQSYHYTIKKLCFTADGMQNGSHLRRKCGSFLQS